MKLEFISKSLDYLTKMVEDKEILAELISEV